MDYEFEMRPDHLFIAITQYELTINYAARWWLAGSPLGFA